MIRVGITVPEVESKAAHPDGAAGLPAAVHTLRVNAVLLEIKHLADVCPRFRGNPHHIEKGPVVTVVPPGLAHHIQKEIPVLRGRKTDIAHAGTSSPPNTPSPGLLWKALHKRPDKLPFTLSDAMGRILMDEPLRPGEGILHHPEGVDLMPADIQLSGMEVSLVNAMSRETILRQYLDTVKGQYSHILIDCQPSLGMLTVNALAAANRVIIPVQAEYLPAKGLEQLLQTVNKVKRQINPKLQIDGILLTMVDNRTNFAKEIAALLRETYGSKIKVFATEIPHSVRAKEISAEGKSIFAHDPGGKVAESYKNLTQEVTKLEKQREKSRAGIGR